MTTTEIRDTVWRLPSDLTEPQSRLLLEKSPPPGSRLGKYSVISVLNAIFYLIKTGCQWRLLPPHYPKWRTVYNHFRSYRGALEYALPLVSETSLMCVKSNFGNSGFIPLEGRWVVERTFSWLGGRRRTNCNYGQYLRTAGQMITAACMMFMLRYF